MSWIFWKRAKPSSTGKDIESRQVSEATLEMLETAIDNLRNVEPKNRAMALDGLGFLAGEVMDDAAREWEHLIGRPWERYTD